MPFCEWASLIVVNSPGLGGDGVARRRLRGPVRYVSPPLEVDYETGTVLPIFS